MRRWLTVFCGLAVCLSAAAGLARAQSGEERAIRALIDRTIQVNNSVDAKVVKQAMSDLGQNAGPFYPPFTASASSPADLEPLVDRILANVSARTFAATAPITVRAEKNQGWAAYTWHTDVTFKDGTRRRFDGRTTAAFEREGKNWKYAHWHSSLVTPFPLSGKELEAEGQALLQIERDAWEALKGKKLDALADYFADDASVFYEGQAYRVRGKGDILRGLEDWLRGAEVRSYQMLDPQVQVFGDAALLTYYYTESGTSAGKEFSTNGKASIVFVKQEGKWKVMHEHLSPNR